MRNGLLYWLNVANIALKNAAALFDWHDWRKAALSFLVTASTVLATLFTMDDFDALTTGLVSLAVACGYFVIAFLCQLVATPPKLAAEAASNAKKQSDSLRLQIGTLSQQLAERENLKALDDTVNNLIADGNRVLKIVRGLYEPGGLTIEAARAEVERWSEKARIVVRESFPRYEALFDSDIGIDDGRRLAGNTKRAELVAFIERRMQRLVQITDRRDGPRP